jgi:hypothetical protein
MRPRKTGQIVAQITVSSETRAQRMLPFLNYACCMLGAETGAQLMLPFETGAQVMVPFSPKIEQALFLSLGKQISGAQLVVPAVLNL